MMANLQFFDFKVVQKDTHPTIVVSFQCLINHEILNILL
jgi:hypothetical protein